MSEPEIFSEHGVEVSTLKWLDNMGWETYGQDGEQWGSEILDKRYDRELNEIIYWDILREQVKKLNEEIDDSNIENFISSLRRDLTHDNLIDGNKAFYQILRNGKKFTVKRDDGSSEAVYIDLIDFDERENNRFVALNQFRVRREHSIRPDINLFVNGIPIVTMELKSLAQENDYYDAIQDLHEYEENVPRLFVPVLFNVAADSTEYRYGSVGAPTEAYEPWRDAPDEYASEVPLREATQAMLNPETLLDMLDNFVFYEEQPGQDAKIVPRYMQYYATNRILDRIDTGEHTKGLIWHTQGSGKSYTMLYTAKNLLTRNVLTNPQVLLIVDTDKLRGQMSDTLSNIGFEQYEVAESIDHLQQMLEDGTSKLILTTIQMFQDVDPEVQTNQETVIMSDEAHRFMEKDLGNKLEAALPDAYHFGFTGTPVRERDRDTFAYFCPDDELYLHRYSIKQGIQDELILPVYFTLMHEMEWDIDEELLDEEFERSFSDLTVEEKQQVIKEYVTQREIAELRPRVEAVVQKIVDHYDGVEKNGWKGMVVTPSRKAAALYGEELQKHRDPEEIEVLITSQGDDEKLVQSFHTTPEERDSIVEDYKKEENPKLLVVCDMLLTGFDAPVLKTMYLDRNLKNHNLLQAIARTNRPAEGKNNGEIVDFQGVFQHIDDALDYDEEVQRYAAIDREELIEEFEQLLDELYDLFEGIDKVNTPEAMNECIALLSKDPETRQEFKQGFRKLENLYESISPDKRLAMGDTPDKYKWINQVHIAFRRSNNRKDNPEDDLREKTKEIIADGVDIERIKDEFPVYEISKEHLEKVENLEPAAQATEVAHATHEHLQPRVNKNPRYKRLSERLQEVMNAWQRGEIDDPDAVEKLRRVEKETIAVKEAAEERDMTDGEYAVYTTLTDEYDEHIDDEGEAEAIARAIGEAFREEVDTSYPNWERNEQARKDIRQAIIDVLVKEFDKDELYHAEDFIENTREYLIENHVQ